MACACKVNQQIDQLHKVYGVNKKKSKTNIRSMVSLVFHNVLIYLLYIPIMPIFSLYILVRKIFTNKPIYLDGLIKRNKNVRNK